MREHLLFISIMLFFIILTISITITGLRTTTGFAISDKVFCEPVSCASRGLNSSGRFYCDSLMCYRDCYQGDVLIEKATFCEK